MRHEKHSKVGPTLKDPETRKSKLAAELVAWSKLYDAGAPHFTVQLVAEASSVNA